MDSMASAKTAVFFEFEFLRSIFFVLGRGVVSVLTLGTTKGDDISHA